MYTFDSYADTMMRGSDDPITTDYGVISVTALHPSQVLACSFDVDNVNRLNRNGTSLNQYLVGDGPISAAVYTPTSEIPLLDPKGMIILTLLLALTGWLLLIRKG